jgi:hypothetical protein
MEVLGVMVVEDDRCSAKTAAPRPVWTLEHVANRPIASHVLDTLVAAGIDDVIESVTWVSPVA